MGYFIKAVLMKLLILNIVILFYSCMDVFSQEYVFFLHNSFLQEYGLEGIHPEYGRVEYQEIINTLKSRNSMLLVKYAAKE